jgi:hypothetical protein
MTTRRIVLVTLLVAAILATGGAAHAAPPRYEAALADGTRIFDEEVQGWQSPAAQPMLAGRPLLDAANPFRWLRDNSLEAAAPPDAFVEYVGGDRMPGRVLEYRSGDERTFERLPAHFRIKPPTALSWPGKPGEDVRVSARWLRRVVFEGRGSDRYEPGTVFFRDGSRLPFRSLRFSQGGARLLLDEGTRDVAFDRIAELHLPRADAWDCYFEQLALLSPEATSPILRVEAAYGLTATASLERFVAYNHGSDHPNYWYHVVQPAWSLDPLWIKHRDIHFRTLSRPERVPLSQLEVSSPTANLADGSHWRWRLNQNTLGEVLTSGGQRCGWGLGVHAPSKLSVPLPAAAVRFYARLGLDVAAGSGGCVKASVSIGDAADQSGEGATTLYQSDFIVGSANVVSPPPVELAAVSPAGKELWLSVDAAHAGRPSGADPLNIRDIFDWLEPELELDPAMLKQEVLRRAARHVPAWQGWTLNAAGDAAEPAGAVAIVNRWFPTNQPQGRFFVDAVPRVPVLTLARELDIPTDAEFLVLAVSQFPENTTPAKVQVQFDGQVAGLFEVPRRGGYQDPDPVLVSVKEQRGKRVKVEVMPLPAGPSALVQWRAIAVAAHRPGLIKLFEDDAAFVEALNVGEGEAGRTEAEMYSGAACVLVKGGQRSAAALPSLPVNIREHANLGEFRFIRFAWKQPAGKRIFLELGHDGRFGPDLAGAQPRESFRYDAGEGEPSLTSAVRLGGPAREWMVMTRDLYADFGEFTLSGLSLASPDGDVALFDHIYLGRTPQDFEQIEAKPK